MTRATEDILKKELNLKYQKQILEKNVCILSMNVGAYKS